MGIKGLFPYMDANPQFFDSHELHDSFLVIDGSNLACELYDDKIRYTCAYGGDYDKYARIVAEFFDDLAKCKITPIVVGDGGKEMKKMDTHFKRANERLSMIENYNPSSKAFITPLATYEVFYSVLKKMGVKIYQYFFEADAIAAALAKILGCPVLSGDSDFFIFDVIFISLFDWDSSRTIKNREGRFVKSIKIFKPENLFKEFPGLSRNTLYLAAVIFGSDYIEADLFKDFFRDLNIDEHTMLPYKQKIINATFKWLSNYDRDTAIEAILSRFPDEQHGKLMDIIEKVINVYLDLPYNIINDQALEDLKVHITNVSFEGNRNGTKRDKEEETQTEFIDTLPDWFRTEYAGANLASFFVNFMYLRVSILSTQVEDLDSPSIHTLSIEIIKVIDSLLVAHTKVANLEINVRNKRKIVAQNTGECLKGTKTIHRFPELRQLRSTNIEFRKKIIDDTLKVTELEDVFKDVPPQWKLYVMVIHFWVRKSKEPKVDRYHIVAVLTSMLFNVIDNKIGYHRSLVNFEEVHRVTLDEIAKRQKSWRTRSTTVSTDCLEEALRAVTTEDCLLAAPLFICNFSSNQQYAKSFDVKIVHVFNQFLSVCKYVLDLNELLGRPYQEFSFAETFNGTLLYNFYREFKKNQNAYHCVPMLRQSPTLQRIVELLFAKVEVVEVPQRYFRQRYYRTQEKIPTTGNYDRSWRATKYQLQK